MSDTTYNGWTNYETWNVALWLDNDQYTQELMLEYAQEHADRYGKDVETWRLSDAIKEYLEEGFPELGASMWSDLLRAAFDAVEWREIAEHYLSDIEVKDDDE